MIHRLLFLFVVLCGNFLQAEPTDLLILGDPVSEQKHGLKADQSDLFTGEQGKPARRLLPLAVPSWRGGTLSFNLVVSPDKPNYLTIRLRSADVTHNRLILICEGKQVGYRHLGDIEILDFGSEEGGSPGAFYDRTTPLPENITKGKSLISCEIRSTGRIWGYGTNFDQYQKQLTEPTRGLYALASHTDPVSPLPLWSAANKAEANIRVSPGPEVLEEVKKRVLKELNGILKDKRPPNQLQMHLLAKAWWVKWTPAYQNPKVIEKVAAGVDALQAAWKADPKFIEGDPAVHNKDWFGMGLAAEAVNLLGEPLGVVLRYGSPEHQQNWANLFAASRDFLRTHRRAYTNQSMIVDLNLYRCHRAVVLLDPALALPETQALRYLHESVGLAPWLGSDTTTGPSKPLGDNFMQLTAKGLTRELGYVGNYGEVIDWVTHLYDATRLPGKEGDPALKRQLELISNARAYFRYPALDRDGNRAMRIETVVGWRDDHFPGDVCYNQRDSWDASALAAAATLLDPASVGRAQQMLADNQFFVTVQEQLKQSGIRTTTGLLEIPDHYETILAQPSNAQRLPMADGMPDFAVADEENGVVAVKNKGEILYASLYWRARHGINNLARIHHLLLDTSRVAVVRQESEFEPSGMFFKRPNWTNFGFANGGMRYPDDPPSAHAGEMLPIAKIPLGIAFKAGQENIHAGRAQFYRMRYGDYLIGMNTTQDKTFTLPWPEGAASARELIRQRNISSEEPLKVGPRSTVVLWLGKP